MTAKKKTAKKKARSWAESRRGGKAKCQSYGGAKESGKTKGRVCDFPPQKLSERAKKARKRQAAMSPATKKASRKKATKRKATKRKNPPRSRFPKALKKSPVVDGYQLVGVTEDADDILRERDRDPEPRGYAVWRDGMVWGLIEVEYMVPGARGRARDSFDVVAFRNHMKDETFDTVLRTFDTLAKAVGDIDRKRAEWRGANPAKAAGLILRAVKSKHGPTYMLKASGKVGRIEVTGETLPINVTVDALDLTTARHASVRIRRADGSGRALPFGAQQKIDRAVEAKLRELGKAEGMRVANRQRKTKRTPAARFPDSTTLKRAPANLDGDDLAELGAALEVETDAALLTWGQGKASLLWTPESRALVIIEGGKRTRTGTPKPGRARATFERWAGRGATHAESLDVSPRGPWKRVGTVRRIDYHSDKKGQRRGVGYTHKTGRNVRLYLKGSLSSLPRVWVIKGGRLTVTARGIIN